MLLDAVDLDLQRALALGDRFGERAAVADPVLLDGPERRAGGAADVVRPGFQRVELFDHGERHDERSGTERVETVRIGDENGRVDDDSGRGLRRRFRVTSFALGGCDCPLAGVRLQVGHRHLVWARVDTDRWWRFNVGSCIGRR